MNDMARAPGAATDGQSLGRSIGTYGKSRSFLFVGWFLAALFGAAGLLVLSLANGKSVRFSGDPALLHGTGYGALALGAATAFLFWRLAASQPSFHLYEQGIRASKGGRDQVVHYRELEDLFIFPAGGIAYRAAPGSPWSFIAGRIHKYGELSNRLLDLQIAHRGPLLQRQLEAGLPVVFRHFDDKVARSKAMFATRDMDFPTHDIVLTRERLRIGQDSIALDRVRAIDTGHWSSTAEIVDTDGQVFFKLHPGAVLSFDLLQYLIARRQGSV